MKKHPWISIIIVNYNSSKDLNVLLLTLRNCTYNKIEIIVIDNASPDDDLSKTTALFPEILLIKSEQNLGFAAANNLGIKKAKGAYYLFLNPDLVVTPGFIEPMLAVFRIHSQVGLVSPKIKYYDNPSVLQYAGCSQMSLFTLRTFSYGKGKKDGPLYNVTKKTSYGHGAAMMVRQELVKDVGLMEESYFLYYEEMDWCKRIRQAGYQIYYVASSVVYHKESSSVQKNSPLKTYYLSRNRLLFARLHRTSWQVLFFMIYNTFVLMPKNIFKYIGKPALLKAYMRGMAWHIYRS
jgi:GT2 family glycosyltransferase